MLCLFITGEKFSKMARFDVSGVGINLREVPDENGAIKLKVLGIDPTFTLLRCGIL